MDMVPPHRRVGGTGASFLMAPFVHASTDRPSRFSSGDFGILYVAKVFETALIETAFHHGRFMGATREKPGWTSQFRELSMDVQGSLHDLRGETAAVSVLAADDYTEGQRLGAALRSAGSEGIVYPSVRHPGGECSALFYPDLAANVVQGRHLDYHWNGERVDMFRDAGRRHVYRIG